ncbi:MAG: carboxypeptidase-like regulatory domain-containing protein [Bacteroidales bacterium]|nr:carboxypeptidase-like regulatory domain-containing protein [Bacteroidales bacterium]
MKTKIISFRGLSFFVMVLLFTFSTFPLWAQNTGAELKFKSIYGEVYNKQDNHPVVFASVFLKGTNIGTVTNLEGKFLIKVPASSINDTLGISSLGYKTLYVKLDQLTSKLNRLKLEPAIVPLDEVVVRHMDPRALINAALWNISKNYSDVPVMMSAFYRESIKKNRNYVSVGEAVLNVYKSSYSHFIDNDRVSIYKGRKSQAVRHMDTLLVKFLGGPLVVSFLDLVKNPGDILSREMLDCYNFHVAGVLMMDGHETYEIQFDQADTVSYPLYKGSIFLDAKTLAFTAIKFEISPKQMQRATAYLVRKKPAGLKAELIGTHYFVKYRKIGDKWFLNYVRMENEFRFKWEKRLFHSNYTFLSEAAITSISHKNVEKQRLKFSLKSTEAFSDKVSDFQDPEFWGASNIIEPESSIQSAIKKISRKLDRWNNN